MRDAQPRHSWGTLSWAVPLLAVAMLVVAVGFVLAGFGTGHRAPGYLTAAWTGPDGRPAERGQGRNRSFEVATYRGADHCSWESAVFLDVAWPIGETVTVTGPTEVRQYVRDPDGVLAPGFRPAGSYDPDTRLPDSARDTGYHTDRLHLWVDATSTDAVYLVDDVTRRVERWPRAVTRVACE